MSGSPLNLGNPYFYLLRKQVDCFCSLVVNDDLPWNPQRIEQRIGRCHRYGKKYNVVVINFLNQKKCS
ncbi:helicase-related protein [Aeribacillus pallidus]|uniref:helicase-related protein n=1 Tax=Aeribacillus pallidus TaxID=33936 RepID=UPI0009EEF1D1